MENTKRFRKRDAILACLCGTTTHPSAEWIFSQLKPEIPNLSLGTVYRNLTYFKDMGKIVSIGTVNGIERFDGNTAPHVHYICTCCGAVIDLHEIAVPKELETAAEMGSGGSVCSCQLTFKGICSNCKKTN
ncbi:MAG: transcriptional repressor [Clostridia bacterium]|nr:transcriptional repressor [Clostridia bacterium]MBQ8861672.1 transcriptional repressor [Clostridia bacterium]